MGRTRRLAILLSLLPAGCAAIAGLDDEFIVGDTSAGVGGPGGTGGGGTTGQGGATGGSTGTGSTGTGTAAGAGGTGAGGGTAGGGAHGGAGGFGPTMYTSCQDVVSIGRDTGCHAYPIATPSGLEQLYCDMTVDGGGWTLVAQISGKFDNYDSWLRADVATANLATAAIESGTDSCINAVPMAVQRASEIRLSNSAIDRWVKWTLAPGRTVSTWWNHAAGYATIEAAADSAVTVHAHDGSTGACYQNVYGIMPWDLHGGSYPSAPRNEAGNTSPDDWCMAVGVMLEDTNANGFGQNNNGWDAPSAESTWPNGDYSSPPIVSVWLR